QSGSTPATVSVSVNTAGLTAGAYNGTVTITSPNAGNTTTTIPVTLTITAGSVLQLSPGALSFAYQIGLAQPNSQTVTVASPSGQVSYTTTVQTSTGGNWLTVSNSTGIAPGSFTVSVNTAGLTAGTYTGTATV